MKIILVSLMPLILSMSSCDSKDMINIKKDFYICKVDGKNCLYYDTKSSGLVQVSNLNFSSFSICNNYLILKYISINKDLYYKVNYSYNEDYAPPLIGPIKEVLPICDFKKIEY